MVLAFDAFGIWAALGIVLVLFAAPFFALLLASIVFPVLDPYFDKLGLDHVQARRVVGQHLAAVLGFSAPYALLLAIPLVGPLAFGLAQAAVTVLVRDVIHEREPSIFNVAAIRDA